MNETSILLLKSEGDRLGSTIQDETSRLEIEM